LPSSILESFIFGVDLCIGAIATDLAIIYAIQSVETINSASQLMAKTVSVLIMHFIAATWAVLTLRRLNYQQQKNKILLVLFVDLIGLGSIFTSFFVLGDLVAL